MWNKIFASKILTYLSLSLFYNHPTFIFEMLAFIDSSKYIIMIPLKIEMKS